MKIDAYISKLLEPYRKAPDFPLADWAENPVSFYAIVNLWDDIFRTAAGSAGDGWRAVGDARMDPDSFLYHVESGDGGRRLLISHAPDGGLFFVEDGRDAGTKLEIVCDLDEKRLAASFQMIRAFAAAETEQLPDLDATFVAAHAPHFGFPDHDPFGGSGPD